MSRLDEIRKKLLEQENSRKFSNTDSTLYPFWNIPFNSTAVLRFLPDANTENVFFWVERAIIKLPFAGIKNDKSDTVTVQIPCMQTYGKKDPILEEIRSWWDDPDLKELARKYYRRKSYILQGFTVTHPGGFDDELGPTAVRRYTISPMVFEAIRTALMDPDMEHDPVDFDHGRDFRLTKTKKDVYANYSTSKWSMKERQLSDEERAAAADISDLSDFLPKEPTATDLEVIMEMFKESVDGQPYDPDKFSKYYTPWGFNADNSSSTSSFSTNSSTVAESVKQTTTVTKPKGTENSEDAITSGKTPSTTDPHAILERIRKKKAAAAS